MALQIKSGQTILFIGDSITDCDRRGTEKPLGNGYVKLFHDLAAIREPGKQFAIINKGIGGDNILSLKHRWADDVLRFQPDWLSIKVGINDLFTVLNGNPEPLTPARYHQAYDEVLALTRSKLPRCPILLIDPFFLSTDSTPGTWRNSVLEMLPDYLKAVHALSKKYGTRLVKTHEMFQRLLRYHSPDLFCGEPVHPNVTGHLVIAEAVYIALS